MMRTAYQTRRSELQNYFGDTAAGAWERLTSTQAVSGIRAAVRAGRNAMHETVLSWLPDHMADRRVMDAGCGTGTFAVAAAKRGAQVLAIDIAGPLVEIAAARVSDPETLSRINWRVGDMTNPDLGVFDHVVAVDSIIHYEEADMSLIVAGILPRVRRSFILTHAPRTVLLQLMHRAGKMFPSSDRAPAIVPVDGDSLAARIRAESGGAFMAGRRKRISSGFYFSEAVEFVRV